MTTLGISTNTRLLGLAIIQQGSLLDYSIHLHKSPWSPSKANEIINSLEPCVRKYCIKKVVLSMPYEYHQTKAFKQLAKGIKRYFTEKDIAFATQKPEALYSLCSPGEKKTKKALMINLTLQFPQLTYYCQKELRNKSKYYIKVFEAVAAAMLNS